MKPGKELTGLLSGMLCVVLWSRSEWALAQDVHVVAGSPDYSGFVRFAAWSWSERAGFDIEYAGLLPPETGHCQHPGSIVFRTAKEVEPFPQLQFDSDTIARTISCIAGSQWVAAFNPLFPLSPDKLRKAVLHEMGHALGGEGHTDNVYSAMFAFSGESSSDYLLTTTDVLWALRSPQWPVVRAPSLCHNELAPDFDLLIPEIVINGIRKRALLNYAGVVDGYHTWDLIYASDSPQPQGCTNNIRQADGSIVLTDIRGMSGTYSGAVLQSWGGKWRLISLTP